MNSKGEDNKKEIFDNPRKIFSDTLVELGKENENIVFISCDSSLGAGGKV